MISWVIDIYVSLSVVSHKKSDFILIFKGHGTIALLHNVLSDQFRPMRSSIKASASWEPLRRISVMGSSWLPNKKWSRSWWTGSCLPKALPDGGKGDSAFASWFSYFGCRAFTVVIHFCSKNTHFYSGMKNSEAGNCQYERHDFISCLCFMQIGSPWAMMLGFEIRCR